MRNILNLAIVAVVFIVLVIGCGGDKTNTANGTNAVPAASPANVAVVPSPVEKTVAIAAKALTKEYETNELAADSKYKGKALVVSGKVSNIAETFGKVSVSLEGDGVRSVICSFEDAEREPVSRLKKGQQITLAGTGDGLTMGMIAGLNKCKVQ